MLKNMQENEIKKPKKRYLSIIFWLALITFAYFSGQYLLNEFSYKEAKENAKSQFSNIESEIYKTTPLTNTEVTKTDDKPLIQNEILLKQQLQISELQNNLNTLKNDIASLKINDSLSKIILSFVRLQDLVEAQQNYTDQLQKLKVLSRADFALTNKIEKLETTLQSQPKNNQQLAKEFANLIPEIKAKEIEIKSGGTWLGKIKAIVAKFIVIKRVGEKNFSSNVEELIFQISQNIDKNQFDQALKNTELLGSDYWEILALIKIDLQNANNFKEVSDDIYKYLELLSN
jgi:hypothetical protein